jgi:PII-like signaling protein
MNEPVKLLLIFVNETDTWNDAPLYQAIVQRLRRLHVAGATAHAGILGFGHHLRVHQKGLFGVPDDRPVTVVAVDDEAKIRAALPALRGMVSEGLILLLEAELVANQPLEP